MDKKALIDLIDTCFDAVNESKAGPIYDDKENVMRQVGFNTFMNILGNLCPKKSDNAMIMKEPKERWEGEDNV